MDLPEFIDYCLQLPHATESTPFGSDTLVYKVGGKIFALTAPDAFPPFANLKCDPKRALILREQFTGVTPAYHMNKKHWNSVRLDHSIPAQLVRECIDHSYALVVKGLSTKDRQSLNAARNALDQP